MEKNGYKRYKKLPLMLTVPNVAAVLGVNCMGFDKKVIAGAYELAYSERFPMLKVGSRIVIPKDKFLRRIEKRCGGEV